ncbi:serine hydrolase [Kitasatospora kazusensis]|uniref:Serine hydrolase n=1 Tax=Kitasatospora kazusensis TaxID=407974 RepID=A0ABN2ZHN7_9ACTN
MGTAGLSRARLDRLHDTMAAHVEHGALPGLVALVGRGTDVHVEALGTMAVGGAEPMRRDTLFRIASMTKPVTAAAAMILVEECRLWLDDPVDPLLPELSGLRVLTRLDAPLDETVPAERPITVRDLLTFRMGTGAVLAPPGRYPIQRALAEAGLAPGAEPPTVGPDEWLRRLGALPLIHQPGTAWMYHTGSDVLGILVERVTGGSLGEFLRERIFEPLGMRDTAFHVPQDRRHRLATSYRADPATGELVPHDDPADSRWGGPPALESGGGGLVSTVDDYLAFCRMMLAKGRHGGGRVLSRPSVELMTSDHLTPEQRSGARVFFGDTRSWGFGVGVTVRRDNLWAVPGRFGWDGGLGTSGYSDPAEDLVGILMTQRLLSSPEPPAHVSDFWTSAYQAIED